MATTLDELKIDRLTVERFTASCGRVAREPEPPPRYLDAPQQIEVIARLKQDQPLIIALAINGVKASAIAQNEGVSVECILKRLRSYGLTRRGRPRKCSA